MISQEFGAHELMEAHEVMSSAVNGINTFELFRQFVSDPQLGQILERQVSFMEKEYNDMISYLSNHRGVTPDAYHSRRNPSVKYGLRNPSPVSPHEGGARLNDRDVASAMLMQAKCGATKKMTAVLECADPQLRQMMLQGAISCAEQAYEIFTYMNQKGMYQVPTMQQRTQGNFINMYQPVGTTHGMGINQGIGTTPVAGNIQGAGGYHMGTTHGLGTTHGFGTTHGLGTATHGFGTTPDPAFNRNDRHYTGYHGTVS